MVNFIMSPAQMCKEKQVQCRLLSQVHFCYEKYISSHLNLRKNGEHFAVPFPPEAKVKTFSLSLINQKHT